MMFQTIQPKGCQMESIKSFYLAIFDMGYEFQTTALKVVIKITLCVYKESHAVAHAPRTPQSRPHRKHST